MTIFSFSSWNKIFKLMEPSWKSFSSSYGSNQLGSDSSLVFIIILQSFGDSIKDLEKQHLLEPT